MTTVMKKYIISSIVIFIVCSSFLIKQQPGITASVQRGKQVYVLTCLTCHQEDGMGVQRMNPTLVKTKWVLGDKKALCGIVLHGLNGGEIEIDGDYFHNRMPPQASLLTDQQIADVLTYVRNSFGNKAGAVTLADVRAARSVKKKATAATKSVKKPVKH